MVPVTSAGKDEIEMVFRLTSLVDNFRRSQFRLNYMEAQMSNESTKNSK